MDLDDVKGNSRDKAPRMEDIVDVYKFPKKKWVNIRLVSGVVPEAGYWVKTKKKDGKTTKFFVLCPSFDPATQERDSTRYDPWRDIEEKERALIKDGSMDKEDAKVQYAVGYWMNAIIRAEQRNEPSTLPRPTKQERESGFKDKDSDSWTPYKAIKLGRSFAGKVKELKGLNTVESKKTGAVKAFPLNDPKFGRDIRVLFDDEKAPADQYQVQMGDGRTPLTEEELAYLKWDLAQIMAGEPDDAAVKSDFESWASRNGVKVAKAKAKKVMGDDDDELTDDEDDTPPPKKTSKKPAVEDEADFDDDGDTPPPKKAPKKPVKAAEDEFPEDEDDTPPPKKKPVKQAEADELDDEDDTPPPPKKKPVVKKPAAAEDDEFPEDEDDTPPPAKKKPAAKTPVAADDDLDDLDDEDAPPPKKPAKKVAAVADDDNFDDSEEETPPPKKKPAAAKKPAVVDEDDFGLDDDEEDTPPPKKPAAKKPVADDLDDEDDTPPPPKKKPAAKKPVVDDLDDDDIAF